jgi:hypothetical protein
VCIGRYYNLGYGWAGDIAEVLAVQGALSAQNRAGIRAYLSAKYGIALPGVDQVADPLSVQLGASYRTIARISANGTGMFAGGVGLASATQGGCNTHSDLAVDATLATKVTSAGYTYVAADVGGWIDVTAGTGWTTGRYFILSVSSGAAVLDRSPAPISTTAGTYEVNVGRIVFVRGTTDSSASICAARASALGWQGLF